MAIANFALKIFVVLGCGLVAGVFFAFSTFIMSALARLKAAEGIAIINNGLISQLSIHYL